MDNASYHSRKMKKIPNSATKKADIQAWSIIYKSDMVKAELLELVRQVFIIPKYAVDEMAKKQNRTILRLPPYHCELNAIELIWAQIKEKLQERILHLK